MKTAIVIDPQKIKRIKKKINEKAYIERAVDQLAYEITWIL